MKTIVTYSSSSTDRSGSRSASRRTVLAGAVSMAPLALAAGAASASAPAPGRTGCPNVLSQVRAVEARLGGKIGVQAFNTGTGARFSYRADERFLLCSVSKVLVVSAALHRSAADPAFLNTHVPIAQKDLLSHAPVTSQHVGGTMTVRELCEAALTVSDNTAANLLIAQCGGPARITRFIRGTGDAVTRLDRHEPDLNDAAGALDTTTPLACGRTLNDLVLGSTLTPSARKHLATWMQQSTTGAAQIRAGLPAGLTVGDKTGSGLHGESNDVAVIWPDRGAPIVMSVFTTSPDVKDTQAQQAAIAATARVVYPVVRGR